MRKAIVLVLLLLLVVGGGYGLYRPYYEVSDNVVAHSPRGRYQVVKRFNEDAFILYDAKRPDITLVKTWKKTDKGLWIVTDDGRTLDLSDDDP
jgi:hypothetical protein